MITYYLSACPLPPPARNSVSSPENSFIYNESWFTVIHFVVLYKSIWNSADIQSQTLTLRHPLRERSKIISLNFCLPCPPPPHPNPLNSNFRVTPPLVITPYHSRRVAVGHIFMCFYTFYCIFSIFLLKFWLLWVISLFVEPPPPISLNSYSRSRPPPFRWVISFLNAPL